MKRAQFRFFEFFAGGGMARLGLGSAWQCAFANEWSSRKAISYRENFQPAEELRVDDIWNLSAAHLPGWAELAWASFPCQDLSLAGNGAGLEGSRSGTLRKFWSLISDLAAEGRAVPIVALENVVGALTSNNGEDFRAMAEMAAAAGYRFGAFVMDAARFVPQSRPRLIFLAVPAGSETDPRLSATSPQEPWHTDRVRRAASDLPRHLMDKWIWWNLPVPPGMNRGIATVLEPDDSVVWHSPSETRKLLDLMSEGNAAKVAKAQQIRQRVVGTVYKRVRKEASGKVQRAEVRFDQISGCLRTPAGGSSRQIILVVEGRTVRSRLLSSREAARLMGMPDSYRLPERYNDAYHLAGDGVVVPVVSFLEQHLLRPLAAGLTAPKAKVA